MITYQVWYGHIIFLTCYTDIGEQSSVKTELTELTDEIDTNK